ncbi:MAG: ABC transporter ATP-binding protein [Candidatus Woykebacteria bacterium]
MYQDGTTHREGRINREIHKLFWQANFQDKNRLILTYLTRIPAVAAYNVFIPLVSAYGIQAIIDKRLDQVNHYALLVILLSIFYCLCWSIGGIAISKQAIKGSKYIQNRIFANFLAKDYDFYTNAYFGSLGAQAARIRDAFNMYGEIVTLALPKQITIVVAGVAIIAFQSLALAVATVVAMLFVLSYTVLTSSWRLQFRRKTSEASSEVAGSIGDSLTHGPTVKSFAMEDYEMQRLQKPLARWAKEQYRTWVTFVPADTGRMLLAAITTAVLLIYSSRLYQQGAISITIVILIQLYVIRLVASTLDIAEMIKRYEEAMGNAYEPVKTMGILVNIKDPESPKKLAQSTTHTLELQEVSYQYPEAAKSQYAVSNFSQKIKPGEKVGLVGYSGSGKTTLTKLLLRFMDVTTGKIIIDGLDIKEIGQKDLRNVISYVPQEPLLFHRSIAENIAYANPNAPKSIVIKAAKMAYVDEFAEELPKGYDTLVGERGVKLSGGQRQRVAIARALLKDSPILVLDEATSALDSKSEKYIQDGLRQLMKNRTSLVIAHRLSTIQRMDRIVVMDKGRVVQNGTHQQLLEEENGIYSKLWSHQSGGYIGVVSSFASEESEAL